ncbi:YoaK family protein [Cupriavidus sp. IDO]|uniref:YoaK family protein n=1 Tax=Cupriavidus sp. IDO TaxID=1539142 RepID=UPI00057948B5|nr:YoaK family protein [Cupriavidus sp. IDO]KWR82100.1 permease [Cupriavidus sp. IDO]
MALNPQAAPAMGAAAGTAPGWLLSFVAGYVDVVGFAALFGLFTAHVTANFIMIGIELAGASEGLLTKILALPTFVVAVAGTGLAESGLRRRGQPVIRVLFLVECALLMTFMVAGLAAMPMTDPSALMVVVTGLLGVAAMGIQNAMSRTALSDVGPTTIMTGNTTQIVIDAVDLLGAAPEARVAIRRRISKMGPAVIGFAVGAILGALAFARFSFWSVMLPAAMLFVLAIQLWLIRGSST